MLDLRSPLDDEVGVRHVVGDEGIVDEGDGLDAGNAAQSLLKLGVEGDVFRRGILLAGRVDIEEEKVIGAEAGVDGAEIDERADEERRSDDEHGGEGDLEGDDGLAAPGFAMFGCGFASFLEGCADFGFGGGPGGSETEEDSGEHGDRSGEGVDAPVEGQDEIGLLPCVDEEFRDGRAAHEVEEYSEEAAHGGDHEAFGEDLAKDSGAAGAEGEADAHLALTGGCSGEHEVRDVGAGEEENESDEGEQDVEGLREFTCGEVEPPAAVAKV